MKKVAVITSTRADFGLLAPLIRSLNKREGEQRKVELIVTGTHLSERYGHTIDEIKAQGFQVDEEVKIPLASEKASDISKDQAGTLVAFTELFSRKKYAGIVILGDRYEMLMVAIAAGNTLTPIFHLCGGDTTEGAQDEWIRHSITKMSYLHFPTNEMSYRRIVQLGENPQRVFNYGSTSIDNILYGKKMALSEALSSLGLQKTKYALCTYHPVTMDGGSSTQDVMDLLEAIRSYSEIDFIMTKSNADKGGRQINELLDASEKKIKNLHVFASLGSERYLSLMSGAEMVIGNSSSGIIEAPALKVPTVNIGDRQRGRLQSESIINCSPDKESIEKAMDLAMSSDFRFICRKGKSPYGDGHAAQQIANKIWEILLSGKIDLKKKFYDIEVVG